MARTSPDFLHQPVQRLASRSERDLRHRPYKCDRDRRKPGNAHQAVHLAIRSGSTAARTPRSLPAFIRTVEDRLSGDLPAVMARLGARSRLQAGAKAADRGWFDYPQWRISESSPAVG
ncbi:hypothetical protein DMH04_07925 [Kibdelosporangium aridum]|uniref:Uncharacterized protein n=1 Tax=Kibdelosporangium aridum TaxID=2030 RepID=A0A428ZKE2_KIBAR|nr:hypothetical protein DMH04_07925 [Kibdelosporangium aridum]